jgi:hypothetical protein
MSYQRSHSQENLARWTYQQAIQVGNQAISYRRPANHHPSKESHAPHCEQTALNDFSKSNFIIDAFPIQQWY